MTNEPTGDRQATSRLKLWFIAVLESFGRHPIGWLGTGSNSFERHESDKRQLGLNSSRRREPSRED